MIDGKFDPAIIDMLKSGQVDLTGLEPDADRCRIALLKHAYLATCMKFGVPQGEIADQVRQDLIAARDAPSRRAVPPSRLARGLTVVRRDEPVDAAAPSVAWATLRHQEPSCTEGVVLAGETFVSRPPQPTDRPVAMPSQLHVTLQVHWHVDGSVSSVDG